MRNERKGWRKKEKSTDINFTTIIHATFFLCSNPLQHHFSCSLWENYVVTGNNYFSGNILETNQRQEQLLLLTVFPLYQKFWFFPLIFRQRSTSPMLTWNGMRGCVLCMEGLDELGGLRAWCRTHVQHLVVRFHLQEQGWDHAYCFLSTDVTLDNTHDRKSNLSYKNTT